jgi:hypothetical protein
MARITRRPVKDGAADGDHVHIHATDEGYSMHTASEEGKVKGPHDHKNLRDLKKNLTQFLDEEGTEG